MNRGGLFIISDEFASIEVAMRGKLTEHLRKQRTTEDSKEGKLAITDFVIHNELY